MLDALWDLVWAGEVTNDTYAPVRASAGGARSGRGPPRGAAAAGPADRGSGPPTRAGTLVADRGRSAVATTGP